MKKQLLTLGILAGLGALNSTEAEPRNLSRDLERQEIEYRNALSTEESIELAQAHKLSREKLEISLKIIDRQLNWVFENFANLNTSGYKKITIPQPMKLDAKPRRLFLMGSLQSTGSKLDLAISNTEGFFKVTGRQGESYFRRNGSFKINQDRFFVDSNGFILTPTIQLGSDQILDTLTINEEGAVNIGTTKNGIKSLGSIKLFHIQDPDNLEYLPDCLCFRLLSGAPEPAPQSPGTSNIGGLLQGFIEMSNVNESEERINEIVLLRQRKLIFSAIQTLTPKIIKQSSK